MLLLRTYNILFFLSFFIVPSGRCFRDDEWAYSVDWLWQIVKIVSFFEGTLHDEFSIFFKVGKPNNNK